MEARNAETDRERTGAIAAEADGATGEEVKNYNPDAADTQSENDERDITQETQQDTDVETTDQKDTEQTEKETTTDVALPQDDVEDVEVIDDVETISVETPVLAAAAPASAATDTSSSTGDEAPAFHTFQVGDTVRCRYVCYSKVPKMK